MADRKLQIDALATKYITLGEYLANTYNTKPDDDDTAELEMLEAAHKPMLDMIDAARRRKGMPSSGG